MPPAGVILTLHLPVDRGRARREALCSLLVRWLALDIGSRRVGLATCEAEERVITPLPALPFAGPAILARAVAKLVVGRALEGVVVGIPRTRSGLSRGERRVGAVIDELRAVLDLPVALVDESGTTAEARARLAAAGVPAAHWQEAVDSLAAQIILETYLASREKPIRTRTVDQTADEC
jgi:putative holliday junction resolvase